MDDQTKDAIQRLNERFYDSSPAIYFVQRLGALVTAASGSSRFQDELRVGVSGAGDTLQVGPDEHITTTATEDEILRFVVADSEVLLHHASETFLRLLIAHITSSSVPWIEIATLRDFRKFKALIKDSFIEPTEQGRLSAAVGATIGLQEYYDLPDEKWRKHYECCEQWIRHFASHFLTESDVYNAAKHGFSARTGDFSMMLADEDMQPIFEHAGLAIDLLTSKKGPGSVENWRLKTVTVSPEASWIYTLFAIRLMDNIFRLGAAHHLARDLSELFLPLEAPSKVRSDLGPQGLRTMTLPALAVELPPKPKRR